MDNITDRILSEFREIGFSSEKSRQDFNNKLHFDFSFETRTKVKTKISNNTEIKELCQIGAKLTKK